MSKIMSIIGIVLVAVGLAIGLLGLFRAGEMQVLGLTYEVAAILLAGGILTIGIGALINAVEESTAAARELMRFAASGRPAVSASEDRTGGGVASDGFTAGAALKDLGEPVPPPRRELDRSLISPREKAEAIASETKVVADRALSVTKEHASETIAALEKAKDDISKSLNLSPPRIDEPAPAAKEPPVQEPDPEAEAEAEAEGDEEQLFVVEERMIRGRPSRVLSDGTVEAETDEGWMRFENLEHLEEYLDAMSPPKP